MKKALLIYRIHRDDPANSGVIKKIKAQTKAFRKLGFEVDKIWLCQDGILLNDRLIYPKKLRPHSFGLYLFYFFQFAPLIEKLLEMDQYHFIYLRHPFFDPLLVRFLKRAKKSNSNLNTILEINTYPYDAEPKRILHRFSLKMDQYFRKSAHQYIDRIADYGQREEIWNIPTIAIRNGIDLSEIPLSQTQPEKGRLRMIAVGNWSYWHGLDRLIKSLAAYYRSGTPETTVSLTIVGDGSEKPKLIELTKALKMDAWIRFLPATKGNPLSEWFNEADIGVGTLGLHRKGVELDSSLKHREYCSRGVPFLLSAPDPDFPASLPFVYYLPNDESIPDMHGLVGEFLKSSGNFDKEVIRKYAAEHLTWENQLQPVKDWAEKVH